MIRIVRAEDERRWDTDLGSLLSDKNPSVRARAALAAGRIGDERAVPLLVSLLQIGKDDDVRAMAAFALGEAESASAAEALLDELSPARTQGELRARVIEALGKIIAALPAAEAQRRSLGAAILSILNSENQVRPNLDRQIVLLGLTAVLRARPEGAGKVIAQFLSSAEPRIRADAANALARLRSKDGNEQLRKLLVNDPDPIVRANAARVLGATEDKDAVDGLVDRAKEDSDSRVRVSAIRAIAALKDQEPRVANALASMWCQRKLLKAGNLLYHEREAECLELVTALGRAFQGTDDEKVLGTLGHWGRDLHGSPPELQVAIVRISPGTYLANLGDGAAARRKAQNTIISDWREASSLAQGLGEIAALPDSTKNKKQLSAQAETILRAMLDYPRSNVKEDKEAARQEQYALPDALRAFAAFKAIDLDAVLRKHLSEPDVVVRATAAELLANLPPTETNTRALAAVLPVALTERDSNDAALAIVDALGKQKNQEANVALKSVLDTSDHLVRRRAVTLLRTNGAGDFSERIGTVQTTNIAADYRRALARLGKKVLATVNTVKGALIIELLPDEAPLTVDNFVQLAKRGYFKNIKFHRVVPNFVIQGGDPRGDGNGGPGYSIRCEINQEPYDRGAVGMALSGKDTGGSQWFVTHSPQPHLEGGYTVFGRVIAGMDVVDRITRGDVIRSIVITEKTLQSPRPRT